MPVGSKVDQVSVIDQISDFVEHMRMQADGKGCSSDTRDGGSQPRDVAPHSRGNFADQVIVEAEQFKAAVEAPKGNSTACNQVFQSQDLNQIIKTLMDNDDDEYFHLTCHIDIALKQKIERGEFVDLEKLLPRTRAQVVSD